MIRTLALLLLFLSSVAYGQKGTPLSAQKIGKFMPAKIKGFATGEVHGQTVKIGTMSYTICERVFTNHNKKEIKIMIFDYNQAPVMYNQGIQIAFHKEPVYSDSIISRALYVEQNTGWETEDLHSGTCQILLGINDRFILMINGTQVTLEDLAAVLRLIDTSLFPAKD